MALLREIVNVGLQKRSEKSVKVRQPLQRVLLPQKYSAVFNRTINEQTKEWENILSDELNVHGAGLGMVEEIDFDWDITPELKLEGEMREVVRAIQEGRKKAGFNVEDRIVLGYSGKEDVFAVHQDEIAREVLATEVNKGELSGAEYTNTVDIDGSVYTFWLKRA